MDELHQLKRIDYQTNSANADSRFSTEYLLGPARGQMFGVLECENRQGEIIILRAFSGQYNSVWAVDGWVPPVFDVAAYDRIMVAGDLRIKDLGQKIESETAEKSLVRELKEKRKKLSRSLMKELHLLYDLPNFRGESRPLVDFFKHLNGPPTGAGDCCAPKLLCHAARNNLRPLGLAEFYWGRENPSGSRQHGHFYSSCEDKCLPILGFILCGAEL